METIYDRVKLGAGGKKPGPTAGKSGVAEVPTKQASIWWTLHKPRTYGRGKATSVERSPSKYKLISPCSDWT